MRQKITNEKCRTPNGRFGVMAAVTPQKRQCKFETLYPAGSVVEAATTPSRQNVRRHPDRAVRKLSENQLDKKQSSTKY